METTGSQFEVVLALAAAFAALVSALAFAFSSREDDGPDPVPSGAELLRKLRRIEISTRRVVNDTLAGAYHSVFKGRGMAFAEVRPYQPGDEIRTIDWNVTARSGDPYVKVFAEERELTVMLLVDRSASGDVGGTPRTKAETAADIAAMLAFSAIKNNDRVGLALFTDRIERFVPPKKGRKHVMRVLSEILAFKPGRPGTSLAEALTFVHGAVKRRCVCFVVSDFLDDGWEKPLAVAARRHDVVPIVVDEPWQEGLPALGLVQARDAETGADVVVDTTSARVRSDLKRLAAGAAARRDRAFQKLQLDSVRISASDDFTRPIVRFFEERAARRRS